MTVLTGHMTTLENPNRTDKHTPFPEHLKHILDLKQVPQTVKDISQWPKYCETPLRSLSHIQTALGIHNIWYKDESTRFGLGSFKALGGAYAVAKQIILELKKRHHLELTTQDLLSGEYTKQIAEISVSCATDGNHGRSVAWGAQLFGCECVIYIHKNVSQGREEAMASYGAKVIRIEGNYDDSVRQAANDATTHNRLIVSDTSYPGYMEIPKDVAMGYTVMLEEAYQQLEGEIPTHIFVQGGVGGLASAVCAYAWQKWGQQRPMFIIVEPEQANCLQESARHQKPTVVTGELDTLMAGLACGEVSALAWDILSVGTDYFMTVSEDTIAPLMKDLAAHDIEAGESAVPGLAACILAKQENKFNLDASSNVLLIGTEGATDPSLYQSLTGIDLGSKSWRQRS